MPNKIPAFKNCLLLFIFSFNTYAVFSGSPGLIWHQSYGETTLNQQVLVTAVDNYDNMFVAGFVNFGSYGNIIINRYDGVGNLMWNRLYNNTQTSAPNDMPVALFPDDQAGVTVVGYINSRAVLTHIFSYDPTGLLVNDVAVGDTTAGSKTYPIAVLYDGVSAYYMIGELNNVSSVFKCDDTGNVIWSVPLHNNFNNQVGSICFDQNYNIIVGVTDSATSQVIIHRYNNYTGTEFADFNTHVDTLPANGNFIKIQIDQYNNVFIAATGIDTAGRTQFVVDKFSDTGTITWSTMCNSARGYSNIVNSFLLDHNGDVLISGPFSDDMDTLQYGAVYKISNNTGSVEWVTIDSQFLVNATVTQVDQYDNVYLGSIKTPQVDAEAYSLFSLNQLTSDSGVVQWSRSFQNETNNTGLLMQVNNFGDLFLATNNPTDTGSTWFLARVGNAANDSMGTGLRSIVEAQGSLTVFPNPFTNTTNIGYTISQTEKLSLKIYDITGQLLQQQELQGVAGYNQQSINTRLASGVYLLKLEGTGNSFVRRVVVY